jgi:ankyrin repeat protein
MNSIFSVARTGDLSEFRLALDGVDINIVDDNRSNLLAPAIAYGRSDIAFELLDRGIDINHKGEREMTPLHLAVQWKRDKVAIRLIGMGSDVNARDIYGNSPLWYAVVRPERNYDLVGLLVKNGSDLHAKNNAGRSAEDFALQVNDERLIRILTA